MADNIIRIGSLKRKTETVFIEGEDGTELKLIVREMNGLERDSYQDFMAKKITYTPDNKPTFKDATGMQSLLLAKTLTYEDGNPVPRSKIDAFPATLVDALCEVATRVNGLLVSAEKDAGKA